MADAVTTRTIFDDYDRIRVHWTCISDGSNETAIKKLDISTLKAPGGAAPLSLDIEEMLINQQGFTSIRILWDHTTDDVAIASGGNYYMDYRFNSNVREQEHATSALNDPRSSGGDGSILLTSVGGVSGATYMVDATFRKRKV